MVTVVSAHFGKVRNTGLLSNGQRIIHTTDRISVFDVILPFQITGKGAILQALSARFLRSTQHIVPNHFVGCLTNSHMLVKDAAVIPIEVVVRRYLSGSLWRLYDAGGPKIIEDTYGVTLPSGLKKNAYLEFPCITPTSKSEHGHDLPLHDKACLQVVSNFLGTKLGARRGDVTESQIWDLVKTYALSLFRAGEDSASKGNLTLVDTKYEFGICDGKLLLVDEVHTPDSSRYWTKQDTLLASTEREPASLSKEFLRELILDRFSGAVPHAQELLSFFEKMNQEDILNWQKTLKKRYLHLLSFFDPLADEAKLSLNYLVPWPINRFEYEKFVSACELPSTILVAGSGGRDYTIYKSFASLPEVKKVFCSCGDKLWDGTKFVSLPNGNPHELVEVSKNVGVGLIISGPEAPIVHGLSNLAFEHHIPILAPDIAGVRLEASKVYCKQVAWDSDVPTPAAQIVGWTELQNLIKVTMSDIESPAALRLPKVIKYEGLAAGKGVVLVQRIEDLLPALEHFNTNLPSWTKDESLARCKTHSKEKGEPQFLIEETVYGEEISVIALCNGTQFRHLPIARDYKRRNDGQQGPNTGGMGSVCPVTLSEKVLRQVEQIFAKTLNFLASKDEPYFGFLFAGLMIDNQEKAWLLEFNCRLGDPETQVVLPGLNREFFVESWRTAQRLPFLWPERSGTEFQHDGKKRIFVVGCAPEYPENSGPPRKLARSENSLVKPTDVFDVAFKAEWDYGVTSEFIPSSVSSSGLCSGGRLFGILATGSDFTLARKTCYEEMERWRFVALDSAKAPQNSKPHYRLDIGAELL